MGRSNTRHQLHLQTVKPKHMLVIRHRQVALFVTCHLAQPWLFDVFSYKCARWKGCLTFCVDCVSVVTTRSVHITFCIFGWLSPYSFGYNLNTNTAGHVLHPACWLLRGRSQVRNLDARPC